MPLAKFREIVDGVVQIRKTFEPIPSRIGTWAGQVGEPDEKLEEPCLFEKQKAFVVLWDGRIATCCIDVEGQGSGLMIYDLLKPQTYQFEKIPLCATCGIMRKTEEM